MLVQFQPVELNILEIKMKLRNIVLGLKDQMPLSRIWRNIRKGGLNCFWHSRTHQRSDGVVKIAYNTKVTALKSAAAMEKKTGNSFAAWKCWRCDGYHIGKNSPRNNE